MKYLLNDLKKIPDFLKKEILVLRKPDNDTRISGYKNEQKEIKEYIAKLETNPSLENIIQTLDIKKLKKFLEYVIEVYFILKLYQDSSVMSPDVLDNYIKIRDILNQRQTEQFKESFFNEDVNLNNTIKEKIIAWYSLMTMLDEINKKMVKPVVEALEKVIVPELKKVMENLQISADDDNDYPLSPRLTTLSQRSPS
jgi:hypothetical protein